jgi:hypothetical protein
MGVVLLSLVATFAIGSAHSASSELQSQAADDSGTLAFTVEVEGTESLDESSILVTIDPAEETLKGLAVGDSFQPWAVPTSAIRTSGDELAVELDPETIPEKYVSQAGLVSFSVDVVDASGRTAHTATSLRRVSVDGAIGWADSMTSVDISGYGSHGVATVAPQDLGLSTAGDEVVQALREGLPRLRTTLVAPERGAQVKPLLAALSQVASEPAVQMDCRYLARSDRWATVGTSYPLGDDHKSWLTHSSSTSSTFGVAVTSPSQGWHESGSRTVGDNWSADYKPTKWKRSYRIEVRYQKYRCTLTSGIWVKDEWKPVYETGGALTNSLPSYPNFPTENCVRVLGGVEWGRGTERGNDYTLSYGVKIQEVLGFDMTSTRAYASSGKLYYYHPNSGRRICGNNAVATRASKMMARTKDW